MTISKQEIKAANILLNYGNPTKPIRVDFCVPFLNESDKTEITPEILRITSLYLEEFGFAKLSELGANNMYQLTTWGVDYCRSGNKFEDYLEQLKKKEAQQLKNQELDRKHKSLQIKDLTFRIKNVEEMQTRQIQFWESGIRRDERQKWQFLLTLLLSIGAFILSVLTFVKSIVLPKL